MDNKNIKCSFWGFRMINKKALSFSTLLFPWLTTPLIGKKSFIRFLPAATFIGYTYSILSEIADKRKWWKVRNGLFWLPIRFFLPSRFFLNNNHLGNQNSL
jgi:hypothetical protein